MLKRPCICDAIRVCFFQQISFMFHDYLTNRTFSTKQLTSDIQNPRACLGGITVNLKKVAKIITPCTRKF